VPFAAISYQRIPSFMEELRARDGVGARALEFLILTVSRSTQARETTWSEIDKSNRVWSAPGDRMKAGRPHLVPLSRRALDLLEEMRPLGDLPGNFVFPGLKLGRPLSDMTLTSLLHEMGHSETVHGFRASFKTWAEQETNHPNVVIDAALAHIVGDKAERVYMRGDWLEKRRMLIKDWGEYCSSEPIQTIVRFPKSTAA